MYAEVLSASKYLLKLPIASEAKTYLDSRMSRYSQDKFDFGYIPTNNNLQYLFDICDKKILNKLNITYQYFINNKNQEIYVWNSQFNNHNIIFPYKDEYGNIISLTGRSILSDADRKNSEVKSKYVYTKNFIKSFHLYGLYQAKASIIRNDYVILVEGQIDCITCHAYGYTNVVAIGGSSLSKYQLYAILKNTKNIYLLLDSDKAGENASSIIIDRYSSVANIKKLYLPKEYKDVDLYLRSSDNYDILNNIK